MSIPSSPVASQQSEEDMSCKVFVGNMSYQTRESELRDIFEKNDIKVVECKIVFKGPRSMGYGFVALQSAEDVDKAVNSIKDLEFDGRKINVERAVARSSRAPRKSPLRSFRGRGRGSFRRGRASSRSGGPDSQVSKTTIYVGNLPFNVVDQDLQNIFGGFNVVSAHVVRKPNGQSKGYGFVNVASEADQAAALEQLVDVECDERRLIIRAAVNEEPYQPRQKKAEDSPEAQSE